MSDTAQLGEEVWATLDRQAAARNAYWASVAAGRPVTGAELGRRFDRTDRWGRMQISKARAEMSAGNDRKRPTGNRPRSRN